MILKPMINPVLLSALASWTTTESVKPNVISPVEFAVDDKVEMDMFGFDMCDKFAFMVSISKVEFVLNIFGGVFGGLVVMEEVSGGAVGLASIIGIEFEFDLTVAADVAVAADVKAGIVEGAIVNCEVAHETGGENG